MIKAVQIANHLLIQYVTEKLDAPMRLTIILAQATISKSGKLGDLNNRHLFLTAPETGKSHDLGVNRFNYG